MTETTNLCRCGRATRDAAYVCDGCGDELARALGDVPWLDEELETSISKQRGVDYRTLGGSKGAKKPSERPSPVQWGASEARAHLRALLVSWSLFCASEGVRHRERNDDLPADTLAAMSRWLLCRVDGLALHEIGSDAVDEITDAVARCRRMVDKPVEKWFAGPCNECKTDLFARAGSREVECSACGLVYDMGERREWLREAARDHLATATEIARAIVVWGDGPASEHLLIDRIRKWAEREPRLIERGHVTVRGRERALYRVGDVMDRLTDDARESSVKRTKAS